MNLTDIFRDNVEDCGAVARSGQWPRSLACAIPCCAVGWSYAQYASADYRKVMQSAGFRASKSRKADCCDNAPMESFFHTLKTELVYHRQYATRAEAKRDIFAYIEGFYNRTRRHSAIGYISPIEMELKAA